MDTITIAFEDFMKNGSKYNHNLYIVWYGDKALYVGIGKDGAWNRWFGDTIKSHFQKVDNQWMPGTSISTAIVRNAPDSMKWNIELRHYRDLNENEKALIRDLRPLFNTTYRGELTEEEQQLELRLSGRLEYILSRYNPYGD